MGAEGEDEETEVLENYGTGDESPETNTSPASKYHCWRHLGIWRTVKLFRSSSTRNEVTQRFDEWRYRPLALVRRRET